MLAVPTVRVALQQKGHRRLCLNVKNNASLGMVSRRKETARDAGLRRAIDLVPALYVVAIALNAKRALGEDSFATTGS
jgi:hypothetical protein